MARAFPFLLCVLLLTGCKSFLNSLAENGTWGKMMKGAPQIPNPATHPIDSPITVSDQSGNSTYSLTRFDEKALCFDFTAPFPGEALSQTKYTVEAYDNFMDDRPGYGGREEMRATNSKVRIIHTSSEVRIVEKYDTKFREMVKVPETFYSTDGQVCFAKPKVPAPTSHFLLLYRTESTVNGFDTYAAWRLE